MDLASLRFDIVSGKDGLTIEPHFCREWDESGGCYGTNPDHGYTLDEAKEQMAQWHESQAKLWRDGTHERLSYYISELEKE